MYGHFFVRDFVCEHNFKTALLFIDFVFSCFLDTTITFTHENDVIENGWVLITFVCLISVY